MRNKLSLCCFLIFISGQLSIYAQTEPDNNFNELIKKAKLGFFFNGGYSNALSSNTNAYGGHVANAETESDNSFFLRYARINGKYEFSPHWRVNLLVNLADFKNKDVSTKVLEIASLTYTYNSYFNLKIGQFRPYFGVEDTYGAAKQKSNYWSNSYSMMGKSNWQSFQVGFSIYGSLADSNIPLKYFFNVYNGNGKNKKIDNDDAKNISGRLESEIIKGVKVGANYASSRFNDDNTHAFGFDLQTDHKITSTLSLQTESQYMEGHNMKDLYSVGVAGVNNVDDFKFKNWYIVPQVRLETNKNLLKALEFSCRYEDVIGNQQSNIHQRTTTPQLSFVLEQEDRVKASIGAILNKYKDDKAQSLPNSDVLYIQLQLNY